MGLELPEWLHYSSVLQGVLPAHGVTWGNMPYMPIALNQLPDDIDVLKRLVAEQVARDEQRQAAKQSVVKKNE